jgi:hypothetical protein
MTVMLLALFLSDAALNASESDEYRLLAEPQAEPNSRATPRTWTPGLNSWKRKGEDCPAFFRREVKGIGIIRVGPRCSDEEIPYAL